MFQLELISLIFLYRYIYVPLGGSKSVILNTVLVFSFVALWHDLTFRLLAWGWLVSLFVIPELAASYLLSASKVSSWFTSLSLNPLINLHCFSMGNIYGIDMFVLLAVS